MKMNFAKYGFLAAAALALSASLAVVSPALAADDTVSIQLPPDYLQYKPGKGVELANQYCVMCHAADYVYMQPLQDKDKWVGVIKKMKRVFGCPVEDKDIDALAEYLAAQNVAE